MQSKIEKIKSRYTIEGILNEYWNRTSRDTKNGFRVVDCPFCGSKEKFWINIDLNICNCFKCGSLPMDVINLFAALNHITNNAAINAMFEKMEEK